MIKKSEIESIPTLLLTEGKDSNNVTKNNVKKGNEIRNIDLRLFVSQAYHTSKVPENMCYCFLRLWQSFALLVGLANPIRKLGLKKHKFMIWTCVCYLLAAITYGC